tara:strand:- start:142 stop:1050 length:909 start_codon:yes stop_codon:yes gene_type:complete
MIYKSSDLAIIIPSINYKNIKICVNSIKNQTQKVGQTIVIFNKKKNFKNNKHIIFSYTNKSNQVFQRNHGLNLINKKIKLILQLDDKFYLHKKAIENLINEWNIVDDNVAGIGIKSNFTYHNLDKFTFLKYITLTGYKQPGKVLISGFNTPLISKNKLTDVDWLQGGLSSWKLKHVPNIFNRSYPLVKWSIFEDLIFSFHVKFEKKLKLQMSSGRKAFVLKKTKENYSAIEYYRRGYEYAKMHKVFVYLNQKKLSKIAFFYSYIISSVGGVLWCSLRFSTKLFFYLGRLNGIFVNIKKIKVL